MGRKDVQNKFPKSNALVIWFSKSITMLLQQTEPSSLMGNRHVASVIFDRIHTLYFLHLNMKKMKFHELLHLFCVSFKIFLDD